MRARLHPVTVRVGHSLRGMWEVGLPCEDAPITCETLEEAQRVAYLCAVGVRPCELLLCDANHHVLRLGLVEGSSLVGLLKGKR